jgi:hypothetical protein
MKDQDGNRCVVETLPMPAPVCFNGQRLAGELRQFLHRQKAGARSGL